MGAHSSFTVGMFGAEGGMALEKGGPADGGLHIGYRTESGKFYKLPFYKEAASEAERYSQSDAAGQDGADLISAKRIFSVTINGRPIVFMPLALSLRSARHFSQSPIQQVPAKRT